MDSKHTQTHTHTHTHIIMIIIKHLYKLFINGLYTFAERIQQGKSDMYFRFWFH